MERTEKIELLQNIADGKVNPKDLAPGKLFMLNLGIIEYWDFHDEGLKTINITLEQFCKVFRKDIDTIILIVYTAFNLPKEHNNSDPSGETLKQIISQRPDLDNEDWQELIATMADLTKTEHYRTIHDRM